MGAGRKRRCASERWMIAAIVVVVVIGLAVLVGAPILGQVDGGTPGSAHLEPQRKENHAIHA